LVKLLDPPPKVRERRMLLDRRITDGLCPRLRQESFPDRLPTAGLADAFHQGVEYQPQHGVTVDGVMVTLATT